jgi:RNA polymerase sigma factor (sigma-70 family)
MLTPVRLYRFASDDHLVDRVRAGSAGAFEALFDRHHRPLLAFCRHMLGSAPDAEDAVQHTFMAAYADLIRSDKRIVLRPWLYSIARHRCLSMLRARRERPVAELPELQVDPLSTEVDAREELRATLSDIAHLPEDQRAALILAELGDASHAEIAEVLGCRQEKVKALVFQARTSLASDRVARETPCDEIREQLALGGLATRRTSLRRHVRDCTGCREFDELVRLQRRRLRILLPVAPSLGFKRAVLGAVVSSGGGAATGVTALVGGLAATAVVTVTVATGGGSPASAAPFGLGAASAAIAGPAWSADGPSYAAAPTRSRGAPQDGSIRRRPEGVAESRGAEPPATPAAPTAPDTSGERQGSPYVPAAGHGPGGPAGAVAPEAAPDPPTEGGETSTPPGEAPPITPPGGRPESLPGGKPDSLPSGKPDSLPSGKPDSLPGGGPPDSSPRGKPSSPPGGRPDSPPGGGPPASPPGGGKPDGPPAGAPEPRGKGKPDGPPGNPAPGPPAEVPDPKRERPTAPPGARDRSG